MADWIENTVSAIGYWGVAVLMLLENAVPPIPSEIVMPLAGFTARSGKLTFAGVVAAGSAGSLLGVTLWYVAAKRLGKERFFRWVENRGKWLGVSVDEVERAMGWFERHGEVAVLLCRMIPGVRTWISIPAGLAGMSWPRFLGWSAVGTVAWTLLLAALGWYLRDNYDAVEPYLNWIAGAVFVLIAGWWLQRVARRNHWLRRAKHSTRQ